MLTLHQVNTIAYTGAEYRWNGSTSSPVRTSLVPGRGNNLPRRGLRRLLPDCVLPFELCGDSSPPNPTHEQWNYNESSAELVGVAEHVLVSLRVADPRVSEWTYKRKWTTASAENGCWSQAVKAARTLFCELMCGQVFQEEPRNTLDFKIGAVLSQDSQLGSTISRPHLQELGSGSPIIASV